MKVFTIKLVFFSQSPDMEQSDSS